MKRLQIATATLLAIAPAFAADPPSNAGKVELQLEFRWGGDIIPNPIKQFSNIPASYRTVPWHPDDDPTGKLTATIADSTLNPTSLSFISFMPAVGLTFYDRLTLRMGFDFQHSGVTKVGTGNDGIVRETEIHSYTFSRLYGTSLVYYAIPRAHWSSLPNPTPEVEIRLWSQIGLLCGGWRKNFTYNIQRGWDRYSAMQVLDNTPFANVEMYHPYIGIRLAWASREDDGRPFIGVVFTVGPTILKPQFVAQAQGTKFSGDTRGIMFNVAFTFGGAVMELVK